MKKFNIGDIVIVKFGLKENNKPILFKNIIGIFVGEKKYSDVDTNTIIKYSEISEIAMIYSVFTSCGIINTNNNGIEIL